MTFNLQLRLATTLLCASFIINSCSFAQNNTKNNITTTSNAETTKENTKTTEEFDNYCNELYVFLLKKNYLSLHFATPNPGSLGISDYKVAFEEINSYSLSSNMETLNSFYTKLLSLDSSSLNEDDKLCFNSIKIFLETTLSAKDLILYYEPLTINTGIQATTPILLLEYPFRNIEDVENYLSLISSLDEYYSSLIDFERQKKEQGLFMSKDSANLLINSLDKFLLSPNGNFMQEGFVSKLDKLELSEEQKKDFISRHNKILEEDFSNAYDILRKGIEELKPEDDTNLGLSHLEKGKEYMEYLINSSIYSSFSDIDSMYNNIEQNLKKDSLEITKLLKKDNISGNDIYNYTYKTTNPDETLKLLKDSIYGMYPEIDKLDYTIKNMPEGLASIASPAFYIMPGIEDMNNTIYIDMNKLDSTNALTKLAHEGIPGHMYQQNYFLSKKPKRIWSLIGNPAYIEGIAVYAESLAYSFDTNLSIDEAKILEKNFVSRLGLYAFLDLSINYYEKDKEYVATYLKENYNITDENAIHGIYSSLTANPCNYLKYYLGYLEINNMKMEAKRKLGASYSDLNFHKFLLDIGPAPFSLIQQKLKANLLLAK